MSLLLLLGVLAGVLTTVTGMGGGVLLLLALSLLGSPAEALAVTSPALLVGNAHRLLLFWRDVDRPVGGALALGALPGSVLGGLLTVALPELALQAILVLATALALTRALGLWTYHPPAAALVPAGFAVGAVAATTGSAGLLVGPLVLASGLAGARYIATIAAVGVAMHLGRIAAYGVGGLVTATTLTSSAALALAVLVGNAAGERLRRGLPARLAVRLELAVLLTCMALALAGLA